MVVGELCVVQVVSLPADPLWPTVPATCERHATAQTAQAVPGQAQGSCSVASIVGLWFKI